MTDIPRQGSGESHTPAGDVMRAEAHADILRLEKYLVAPGTPFAADAGGLGATKRLTQVPHVLAVYETHAGLDGSCHAVRAPEILAPDVAAQSVLNVVRLGDRIGLVTEGNEAGHGPENLLLRDTHAIVDIGENGGPDVVAGAHPPGQFGSIRWPVEATAQEGRSFLGSRYDVTADFGQVILADHRTDERRFIERVADADPPRALGEPCGEIGIDRFLHQDARTRGTALTVVREHHEEGSIERPRQIGV